MNNNLIIKNNSLVKDISLSKQYKTVLKNLSEKEKEIFTAYYSHKTIRELKGVKIGGTSKYKDLEVRQFYIRQYINTVIFDCGSTLDSEDIKLLTQHVIIDIITDFKNLNLTDIKLAFHNGCRNKYGDFYGINTRTFYSWISSYVENTKSLVISKANKIKEKLEYENSNPSPKKINEIEKEWLSHIYKCFDNFCEKDVYNDILFSSNNIFYNFLIELKLIVLSNTSKKIIFEKAKKSVISRYNELKVKNVKNRNTYKEVLNKITNKDETVDYIIKNEAKSICVRLFLENLKKNNLSLKTKIENAKDDY